MTGLLPRHPQAHRRSMIVAMRALAILATAGIAACSGRESASSNKGASSVEGPEAQAKLSRGHLLLTGDATVDTDFAIEQCTIGAAGDGPLNGYRMSAKPGHGTLQLLSLAVKSYDRDGSFTPAVDTGKPAIKGKHGVSGPLSMMLSRENSTVPLPVITRPESHLTITISDSGSRGTRGVFRADVADRDGRPRDQGASAREGKDASRARSPGIARPSSTSTRQRPRQRRDD